MKEKLPPKDKREIGLFRFFIRQNVFLNIVYVGVFVVGVILWAFIMNREAFGNFDFDLVQITTPFPGATAEEVEHLVTMPLENALKTAEGIEEMGSISVEGLSVITIQLDPDAPNKRKNVRQIEREVDRIRTTDLPDDGDEPQVVEITAAFPVITVGVSGNVEEMRLRSISEDLEDDLLDIEGVSRVDKKGFKEKEIWVEADLDSLTRFHLSLLDLVDATRQADHTSPGGRLEIAGEEIIVRTLGKLETVDDVNRVVVRANEAGRAVRIADVARVTERLERERSYIRLNGARAIELDILKKDTGDTLKIDNQIKDLVDQYRQRFSPEVEFAYANEISFYIERRLDVLVRNGFVGLLLVLFIMFLFLSPQSAFWSTSAIPFAFLGGLIAMHMFGLTINLISLFAFILVSGMLVDNGIVVAEYIETKQKENLHPFTRVSVGISEMALPVFAAGLTTIIAFAPLAFMSGITGKFLRQMPMVLIACLVADLIECLFILPGHLYHYDFRSAKTNWYESLRSHTAGIFKEGFSGNRTLPGKIGRVFYLVTVGNLYLAGSLVWWAYRFFMKAVSPVVKIFQRLRQSAQSFLQRILELYERWLSLFLKRPLLTMFSIALMFALVTAMTGKRLRFQMFPNVIDMFVVSYEMPTGVTLKETEKVALGLEKILAVIEPEQIEAVSTQVGSQGDRQRSKSGTNVGEVRVFLNKRKLDRPHGSVIIDSVKGEVTQFLTEAGATQYEIEAVRGGPPVGKAIEIQIIGNKYENITMAVDELKDFLNGIEGTVGITDDLDRGKKEIRLTVDREAISRAGLSPARVASVIRAAFDGEEAVEIKRVGETNDIGVLIKLTEESRYTKTTLDRLTITTPRGQLVPLSTLVTSSEGQGLLTILRQDGDRAVTVKGDVDLDKITSAEVSRKAENFLNETLPKYPGLKFKFSGEKKNQDESMRSLLIAITVALALIFLVLATLFGSYWDPIIIMSVVPFALTGVFLSLLVPHEPITLLVLIGFTGLTGVVVNNSILLIETFKRVQDQMNLELLPAVIEGAKERVRPIFLTSLSTFFGVMPLGYGLGGKEPFLEDMAYTFGWGLFLCSFITVFWVPSFYLVSHRIRDWAGEMLGGKENGA